VFAWYKWLGWLDSKSPVRSQLPRALDLADRFAKHPESFPDDELMPRGVPQWIHSEMQTSAAWIRSIQTEPALWLRAKRDRVDELVAKLHAIRDSRVPNALRYAGDDDLFRCSEFHAGQFEIQDLASQMVGLLCDPKPGETWWDACAGEGGKTLHLSELMENRGLIWASDRAGWRLKSLERRAARAQRFNYRTALWNGGARLPTRTRFDGVLVDAPCSGVGTWQRNPDARWTTTPKDVRELGEIQNRLLANAVPAIKSAGRLIYAVCTLTRVETDDVVERFENQFPEFAPEKLTFPFGISTRLGRLWLRPEQTGGNGMFVAAWIKR
jgi:16S rRNA (cytosine967-C5)-methyltransferase